MRHAKTLSWVDLGGTNLRIAAIDESGKQFENIASKALAARGCEHVLAEITPAISSLKRKFGARVVKY